MEEKKLTYYEIVKALECCAGITAVCNTNCPAYNLQNKIPCQDYMNQLALNLIHRLQAENERLNDMQFTQEHCNLYEENKWLKVELQHQQKKEEQAVKDTAKEIYQEMYDYSKRHTWYCLSPDDIEMFASKRGVEVE